MDNQMQRSQDPLITTRSTTKKKNSKGGDWTVLYVDQDQVHNLIAALHACAENPRGARVDIHTNKKAAQGGREFDSTIVYVKPCQERQEQPGGFGGSVAGAYSPPQQGAPRQYAPRGAQSPQTRAAVQAAYTPAPPVAPRAGYAPPQYAPRPAYPTQAPQQPAPQETGFAQGQEHGHPVPPTEDVPF